jgi:hypothetical protein
MASQNWREETMPANLIGMLEQLLGSNEGFRESAR